MIGTKEMRELSSLKRELKCWENMFQRAHGRKPNKEDIEGGPKEIKDAYRKYKVLKGSLSKEGRDGDKEAESDDVFGKDLNKKKKEEKEASIPFRVKQWADITPVKLCHGQRPKKNEIQAKDDDTCDDKKANYCTLDGSISERSEFEEEAINIKFLDTSEQCITSSVKKTFSSNFLCIKRQSKLNQSKRRTTVSSAWLEKCKPDLTCDTDSNKPLNGGLHKVHSESDNLSTENHICADQVTKGNDVSPRFSANGGRSVVAENGTGADLEGQRGNLASTSNKQKSPEADNDRENSQLKIEEEHYEKDDQCMGLSHCQFYEENNEDGKGMGSSDYGKNASKTSIENSLMASPTLSIKLKESGISKLDIAEEGDTPKAKGLKRKAALESPHLENQSKKSRVECDLIRKGSDVKQEEYEQSIVREKQGSNGDSNEEDLPTTNKKANSSSTRHSSGLVSENFKRLDMKHRSYRRRGGGISGGAYKRRAWKQIMKSRGEFVPQKSWSSRGKVGGSGKTGVCFKCGQEGHWAKNCRGPKKHKTTRQNGGDEPEDTEMEDFEQFPTIEEAAMMAAGVPIASHNNGSQQDEQQGVARGAEYGDHVLLPHQLPRPVYTPPTPPPTMEPLYLPVDGKPVDPPKDVFSSLKKLGFTSFRTGQQDAVMRILCGLSTLVVLSTGAGKSLCYQLPAFLYSKRSPCLTLVISPLVSLMEDQITGLPHGLKGACLHTNLTKAQRQKVTEDLCGGKVSVLLLSPEALVGGGSGNGCLPPVSQLPPVAFACIDEAHCVSEWSHNFRPSYLRVCKVLREKFGVRCFLGLTATATRATAASVAEHLGIAHDTGAVIRCGAVPPNLSLSVSCDTDRTQALLQLLQGRRFSQCDSIIIYCTRREQTEKLASTLRTCLQSAKIPSGRDPREENGVEKEELSGKKRKGKGKNKKPAKSAKCKWDAECYHAGMSAAQRRQVQKRFMAGQLRVVVATVAFGMGLDKSDVRAIVHYNLPRSFESYVQEIGRAGRDGLPAHCHVFLDPEGKDMCELRRHVYANTVDRSTIKKLVNNAFPRCHCKELYEKHRAPLEMRESNQKKCLDEGDAFIDDFDSNIEAELEAMELNYHESPDESVDTKQDGRYPEGIDTRQGTSGMAGGNHDKAETESVASREDAPANDDTNKAGYNNPSIHYSNSEQSVTEIIVRAGVQYNHITHDRTHRLCGGHEVAMPTELLIQELDMREESIATLLCYLELHPNRWLEVLQPVKSTCTVKFYGGKAQLRSVAQKIPPIAAAVSHNISKSGSLKSSSTLTFPVVEVADKMGWDLVPVTRELRALQWNTSLARDPSLANMGQSGILVEFSDLSFHHRAPGDLSDVERDSVCDFLEDRILAEERSSLQQLQFVYDSLKSVSCSEFWQCADTVDEESDKQLKNIVQSYFEDPTDKTRKELTALMKARKGSKTVTSCTSTDDHVNWDVVTRDIRALVGVHHDHSFTGRAVARIFHGIDSPCYPAEVWGRDRRFWRKHLDVEFNSLRKFATRELIRLR